MRRSLPHVAAALAVLIVSTSAAAPPTASTDERRAHFYKPANKEPSTAAPRRIVSLAPVLTETLFALGAGERVVGVTRYCDRPKAAKALPKVGGFIDPQLEAILALKPDLVVTMPSRGVRTTLDRLRDHGVPVLVAFGDTIDEVRDLMGALGRALDADKQARELLTTFDKALAKQRVTADKDAPRVLVLVGARPLIAAGPTTFADEAVRWVGGRRALPDDTPAWPSLSVEAIGSVAPDVIVAAGGPADAAALTKVLAPMGHRRPPIVHGDDALLMRPGPTLHHDVAILSRLLREAAQQPASPQKAAP